MVFFSSCFLLREMRFLVLVTLGEVRFLFSTVIAFEFKTSIPLMFKCENFQISEF